MNFVVNSVVGGFLLLSSFACSVKTEEKNELATETRTPLSAAQTVQINKSIVEAEIIEKYTNTDSDFIIKAKVLKVEATDAYPSIATASSVYILTPAFVVDDSGNLTDNDKNKGLKSLLIKKGGDKIKAVISMGKDLNWYIQEILD